MIGNIAYIIYIGANIWAIPLVMYIGEYFIDNRSIETPLSLAASFAGLAAAPFWTAQATYINRIARYYAYHRQKNVDHIISLFFGIFFAVLNTCSIWGNMISYFVLNQSNIPQKNNCGIYFDPLSKHNDQIPAVVSDFTVNRLENYFPICFLR